MEATMKTLTEAHLLPFRDYVDSNKEKLSHTELMSLQVHMDQIQHIMCRVIKICEEKQRNNPLKRAGTSTGEEPVTLRKRTQEARVGSDEIEQEGEQEQVAEAESRSHDDETVGYTEEEDQGRVRESVAALFHLTTEETPSATECTTQSLLDPQPSASTAAELLPNNAESKNLDMSQECLVCLEAKIQIGLDCHHKFCCECLHQASTAGDGKRLRCPLCRHPVELVYPLPGMTHEEIPQLQLCDRDDDEQVVSISSDEEALPDLEPVAMTPTVHRLGRGTVHLSRHGHLPEGLYDWAEEMTDYGFTAEIRRSVSMDQRSRMVHTNSTALTTALRYRHKYMPETHCMTCFASSEEQMPKTLCCSRQMCFDCVGYMAEKQVEVCRHRTRPIMEIPKCPACGYKPKSNKTRMTVSSRRGPRRGQTTPTDVVEGDDNFVQCERSPEGDGSAFQWDNVRFAQFFWSTALETWPELGERNPQLLAWAMQ